MEEIKLIEIKENILSDNDEAARQLRQKLADEKTFAINLMSSPGAGKTSLLLQTIERLKNELRIGVIEADIDSVVDAEKIRQSGAAAVQLRTGGFCHLDAAMVKTGLDGIGSKDFDLIFIENVGNLVCPAEFDTGAMKSAMILSVPEGDDKPLKYPLMFTVSDVLLVNKTDMMALSDFDTAALRKRVHKLHPEMEILEVSAKTGAGMDQWVAWIRRAIEDFS
ncbi:MAG: hydrogenase nickel incorporation protein HypB [Desulfosalsimonas sp.]|uniref:hydrogenase nickel incorporation protein HypB n=1 Tax=Desulfosalsimonas sp. TaxID=3073848 RepID=UPI003970F708